MKKIALYSLLAGFGLTMVSGCNSSKNNQMNTLSFESMYNYSAISGINLLKQSTPLMPKMRVLEEDEKTKILENLKVVENMLADGVIKSEEAASDKAEYEFMYTITTSSLAGNKDTYTFYYNEQLLEEEIDDDDDDEDEKEEMEQEYALEGLVILNNEEFLMRGEKEIEGDEIEMSFKVSKDENSYVVIEQEKESDEQEFSYTLYENGKKTYETEIDFEVEPNNKKVEVEFEEKTVEGKKYYQYEFVLKNEQKYIYVKIKENNEVIKAVIRVEVDENNQVNYIFEE